MRPRDYGAMYVGWVIGWIGATLFMLLTNGCASAPPRAQLPGVLPVAVVSWPAPIKPDCELSSLPEIPDVILWTQVSDEEAGRIYVTQRALADLIVWFKDVKHHSDLLERCLGKLVQ